MTDTKDAAPKAGASVQIDTKDTTSCRNASEWWAAQLMPDVNLMRH